MAKLMTPRDHIVGHPDTPDAFVAVGARRSARRGRTVRADGRALVAYVSRGCWVADCPACHAGIAIDPEWSVAQCLGDGCFRTYTRVTVPANWRDIEDALDVRPRLEQHWQPTESVESLRAWNETRGERGR